MFQFRQRIPGGVWCSTQDTRFFNGLYYIEFIGTIEDLYIIITNISQLSKSFIDNNIEIISPVSYIILKDLARNLNRMDSK